MPTRYTRERQVFLPLLPEEGTMNKRLMICIITGSLFASALPAAAKPARTGVNAELEAGREYDSTLSVVELDQSINTSDIATVLKAKLDGHWQATEALKLRGGYSYQFRNYDDFSEYDLGIQQWFGDASYDFGTVTLGASHFYATAELDDADLLDLNQTSIYLSRLFDQRVFVRLAADSQDKQFDGRPERDADNRALAADVYVFFNQAQTFVSVGLKGEHENANSAELDYRALGIKSKLSHKFDLLDKDSKVVLSYQYQDRDYDNQHPVIGSSRKDRRQTTRLEWEVDLNPHLALVSAMEYGDYSSNLESIDYSETVASVAVKFKL